MATLKQIWPHDLIMLGIGNTVAYYIILHGCFYVLNTLKCRGQKKKKENG